jgi:prepilin-type N-terminal cleavage/methylation domain-containing protein
MQTQRGFTLIEMIGVLAVIAILAAIVSPKIFDAIRDAKTDSLVTSLDTVRSAIVQYYKDTSTFPQHDADPTLARAGTRKDMITDPRIANPALSLRGWQGPYLDKELENPINPNGDFVIVDSSAGPAVTLANGDVLPAPIVSFDIDGDGTADYSSVVNPAVPTSRAFVISYAHITGLTTDEARRISETLDSDMEKTTGNTAWWLGGRVRVPVGAPSPLGVQGSNVSLWVYLGSR